METDPPLDITAYDLPESISKQYLARGMGRLYPWQAHCLHSDGVLQGRNLVYKAPTLPLPLPLTILLRRLPAAGKPLWLSSS